LCPAEEIFHLVSVDPIEDVEEAVETETGDIVAGEVLYCAHFVEHDDLGDEGDGFEPEGEAPGELPWGPSGVEDAS